VFSAGRERRRSLLCGEIPKGGTRPSIPRGAPTGGIPKGAPSGGIPRGVSRRIPRRGSARGGAGFGEGGRTLLLQDCTGLEVVVVVVGWGLVALVEGEEGVGRGRQLGRR